MKLCSTCKKNLPLDNYTKNKNKKDGLEPICRGCKKKYYHFVVEKTTIANYTEIPFEIWKRIDGFNYEVSNMGRVKSLYQEIVSVNGVVRRFPPCLLSPATNEDGYKKVSMSVVNNNGLRRQKLFSVHRLVASAFLPNPENYDQVNHKDGDKSNNSKDNLEWCNASHNIRHAYKHGLLKAPIGEKCGASKLTKDQVLAIREIGKSKTLYEIADLFGISFGNVSDILNRESWKHI